ncbi:probable proline--tRNA ligase, mitochondrial isoform X2 [Apis cerana]|uniref:probable proline--tRNA ligase, mitochondrial isoform X2 n=1 Tax=Apis cerana TaxID=7461 RepID=UPI002B22C5B8|nr:probable proline--tRNA ligase, mitochondrial isoform X2 [Apis cerana]
MSNMPISKINKLSQLFQPVTATIATAKQTEIRSRSYENLLKYGLIKQVTTGMYAILPLGLRIFNKLTALVDNEMQKIGAQKLLLPALIPTHLWKKTDRFNNVTELFKIQDRAQRQYILSPTHEESICSILSTIGILSPKMLPLKLYQISNKWRDEMKPRLGFLRSREFIMKDLYTFDINLNNAQETYALVCNAYENIFKKIGIMYIKTIGDPGLIGGSISHEYHYVGHTFLLNTKYTIPLEVKIKINNKSIPLVMGCFGLGLSRIFTVMTELLSTKDELRWPKNLAPYTVCLIPPKAGSKEENKSQYIKEVMEILNQLNIDTILDDRTDLTIGKRFMHARITGFPYVIIIGKSIMNFPPLIEIHNINNSTNCEISLNDIPNYFNNEDIKL